MDFLKELFGEDGIKYDEFVKKVNEKGYKLADLSKGSYVDKKKYDDEVANSKTKYSDLEKRYNDLTESIKTADGGMQKKYDDLLANYNTLKSAKETVDKEIVDFKRKEIARGAGISNDRMINLALFELKDSENFDADIKSWAESNKAMLTNSKTVPPLGGNPKDTGDDGEDKKFFDAFYKSAGIDEKDIN